MAAAQGRRRRFPMVTSLSPTRRVEPRNDRLQFAQPNMCHAALRISKVTLPLEGLCERRNMKTGVTRRHGPRTESR